MLPIEVLPIKRDSKNSQKKAIFNTAMKVKYGLKINKISMFLLAYLIKRDEEGKNCVRYEIIKNLTWSFNIEKF